jgi:hypothetical protein
MAGKDDDTITFDRKFFADARRKAWEKATQQERKKIKDAAGKGLRAWWDGLTAEERSAEMRRRAKVRERNRKAGATTPQKQR